MGAAATLALQLVWGRNTQGWDVMDKALHHIFNGAFGLIRVPLLLLLMASIVISLARRRPGRLEPAEARKSVPDSLPPPA